MFACGDVNVATKEDHLSLSIAPIPLLFILPQTDLSDHPLANRQKGPSLCESRSKRGRGLEAFGVNEVSMKNGIGGRLPDQPDSELESF